jgi:serine/threonine protein kinase
MPLLEDKQFRHIVESTGGPFEFTKVINNVLGRASYLRGGIDAFVTEFKMGGNAIIAKVCFEDEVCWAGKVMENDEDTFGGLSAARLALTLVEKHCSHIPIPHFKGSGQHNRVIYYFTEWIEGKTLQDKLPRRIYPWSRIRLPNTIVSSLAGFVYNLTTCGIPKNEYKHTYICLTNF